MSHGLKKLKLVVLLMGLVLGSFSFAKERTTYRCSLKVFNEDMNRVWVDIQNQEVMVPWVASNEEDSEGYVEAFEALSHTLQKEMLYPAFFTLRLLPAPESGNQGLNLEVSIQLFNRFRPSKMAPLISEAVPVGMRASVQHITPNNQKIHFTCE